MRVAMGLSYNEKNPTEYAKKFYSKMSRMRVHCRRFDKSRCQVQLALLSSNCYLLEIHDDMEHIAEISF